MSEIFYLDPAYQSAEDKTLQLKLTTLTEHWNGLSMVLGSVAGIFCLYVLYDLFFIPFWDDLQIRTSGLPAQATLIKCWTEDHGRSFATYIQYQYSVDNAASNEPIVSQGNISLSFVECSQLEKGDTIHIRYDSANPESNRVHDDRFRKPFLAAIFYDGIFTVIFGFATLMFLVFVLLGPAYVVVIVFALRKFLLFRQSRTIIEGTIVEFSVDSNREEITLAATYQFQSPTSEITIKRLQRRSFKGKSTDQFSPPSGTPVKVLYANDQCHVIL